MTYREEPLGSGTLSIISSPAGGSSPQVNVGYTAQAGVFAIGSPDFVKAVVAAKSGSSLADAAGYKDAMARAGGPGVEDLYLDLTSLRQGIEALAPNPAALGDYPTAVQPYLAPFDRFVAVVRKGDGGAATGRAVLIFTH